MRSRSQSCRLLANSIDVEGRLGIAPVAFWRRALIWRVGFGTNSGLLSQLLITAASQRGCTYIDFVERHPQHLRKALFGDCVGLVLPLKLGLQNIVLLLCQSWFDVAWHLLYVGGLRRISNWCGRRGVIVSLVVLARIVEAGRCCKVHEGLHA